MATTIIVNNVPIEYPEPGDQPGWGEGATTFAQEVATVLSDIVNPNDILETTFTIDNDNSSADNVTGLAFNTGQVRSAEVSYSIYRLSDANPSGNVEAGVMFAVYDNDAASGSKWLLAMGNITGPGAGVNFTITDTGQVQYTSTDIDDTGYSGEMRFRAKTILST